MEIYARYFKKSLCNFFLMKNKFHSNKYIYMYIIIDLKKILKDFFKDNLIKITLKEGIFRKYILQSEISWNVNVGMERKKKKEKWRNQRDSNPRPLTRKRDLYPHNHVRLLIPVSLFLPIIVSVSSDLHKSYNEYTLSCLSTINHPWWMNLISLPFEPLRNS